MSDYDFRPGGSLKLKGGVSEGGIVKKKKKKSKAKSERSSKEDDSLDIADLVSKAEDEGSGSGSGRASPAVSGEASASSRKTEAEKRFEAVQKKRLEQRIAKVAHKTHKDRVNEFNTHLESLSEHHDIPKVGPG
ncbi:hypothetical protein CPB83DRAFT_842110 [Crepidotus variabilis]|uniref:DUF1754-domain-containing protein n=1 Tax=Crepidotus variabilis TaxID=179855 RepID=A0A9P6JX71_9AGAR|nr:hypothetical protein CPB83DRAFT_842110 [Crepidotus variabilis]